MVSGVRVEGVAMVVGVLDLAGALQRLGRGGAVTRDKILGCPPKKKKNSKDHCNGWGAAAP